MRRFCHERNLNSELTRKCDQLYDKLLTKLGARLIPKQRTLLTSIAKCENGSTVTCLVSLTAGFFFTVYLMCCFNTKIIRKNVDTQMCWMVLPNSIVKRFIFDISSLNVPTWDKS